MVEVEDQSDQDLDFAFPSGSFGGIHYDRTFSMFTAKLIEPHYEKTDFLHMRKQRRRSASW